MVRSLKNSIVYSGLIFLFLACDGNVKKESSESTATNQQQPVNIQGMVWIPGGTFTMGTNETDAYSHERPAHQVKVDGFWMDETEVTNARFQEFVEATGYKTIAER